jgi:chloramphenicol 3-O phosphotransferase
VSVARRGRILLLNGVSSSGKTTIAKALQARLPEIWLEMGIDRFAYALPGRVLGEVTWPLLFEYVPKPEGPDGAFTIETTPLGQRFVTGIHETARGLAELGLNVIVDHVLLEGSWLDECRRLWAPYRPLYVGLVCPLEVILERERNRGDRTLGQAEAQFERVHAWGPYDLEVDTSVVAPAEAADRIAAALDGQPS